MIRLLAIFFLLLLASGCSDSNSGAPDITEAHPDNWLFAHPGEARDEPESCRSCHGANFEGIGNVIGCTVCHPFGLTPQAPGFVTVHPLSWGTSRPALIQNHQSFPLDFSWTTCATAACHGEKLEGGATGPSCFVAECHGNPAISTSPHPIPFALPQQHGPLARDSQLFCRNCHGRPPATFDGGYVADPAILNRPGGNCIPCHPAAQAHPTRWQGGNDLDPGYSATHRAVSRAGIEQGCSLCHDVANTGSAPVPAAPSCFTAGFTNAEGSATGCHPGGPFN